MDLKLHAPGHAEEVTVKDEHGIEWRAEVTPLMPLESEAVMKRAGLNGTEDLGTLSPAAAAWARDVAHKHVQKLLGATFEGEGVTINGAEPEKADIHELLQRHTLLARLLALKALDLGGAVLEQRGN